MSKDTPEVGDVFKYKNYNIYVIDVQKDIYCKCFVTDGWAYWVTGCPIYGDMIYLGKSKANIDDLFKTENEE